MKRLSNWRNLAVGALCAGTVLQSGGCALNAEAFAYTFITTLFEALLTTLAASA